MVYDGLGWLAGFLTGILLLCYTFFTILYRLSIKSHLVTPLPRLNRPLPLPHTLIARLLSIDKSLSTNADSSNYDTSSSETANWVNVIMQWIVSELFRAAPVLEIRREQQAISIESVRRHRITGRLCREVKLIDYDPGSQWPQILNIRTLSRPFTSTLRNYGVDNPDNVTKSSCSMPLSYAMDVTYAGDIAFMAHFETILAISRYVRATCRLKYIHGRILLCLTDQAYHYTFFDDASLKFEFEVKTWFSIDQQKWFKIRLVDWLLSKIVMPKVFRDRYVVPNMKGKWWPFLSIEGSQLSSSLDPNKF